MKRLMAALIIWLALFAPCAASTIVVGTSTHVAGSGNANNAVPVPLGVVNGDTLMFCFLLNSQTVTTLGGTFSSCTNFTSLVDVTGGGMDMKCGCRTASSEPSTYTPTWTGNSASTGMMFAVRNSDGTTPAIDVAPTSTSGGAAPASVTTSTDNDLILAAIMDNTAGTGLITGATAPMAVSVNLANAHLLVASQKTAGATSWLPSAITFGGAGTALEVTIAVKANTTTAVNLVGVGSDSYNSGSAASVSPGYPPNANTSDILLAGITEVTNTGITITPPAVPDIQLRETPTAANVAIAFGTTPRSAKVSTLTQVGDRLFAHLYTSNTITPP